MSRYKGLLAATLLSALPLSGCFKSDFPLLTVFGSVTPVPEGVYTYVDTGKAPKSVVITHDWTVTKMISTKDDGSANIVNLLMDDLGEGFFLVMDPDNNYSLIHVNPKAILQFDESTYCDNLLSLARSVGKSIAEYGVVKVLGEKPHVCKFNDLGSIERAMAALASSRTDTSNGDTVFNLLVISRIYRRS